MNNSKIYIDAAGLSDTGKVRQANEDSLAAFDLTSKETFFLSFEWKKRTVENGGILLAVADGMGGAKAGEIASRTAIGLLGKKLFAERDGQTEQTALREQIRSINLEIKRLAENNPKYAGMGTTLTAVLVSGSQAQIGQIGDSRAYLYRRRLLSRLTKDQSWVQVMVDAGALTQEQAEISPQKNVILSAIGVDKEIDPVIREVDIERGDYLLLCSDGLTNMVREDEISDILAKGMSLSETCRLLVDFAQLRGGTDNISVILAQFFGRGLPAAVQAENITKTLPPEVF